MLVLTFCSHSRVFQVCMYQLGLGLDQVVLEQELDSFQVTELPPMAVWQL